MSKKKSVKTKEALLEEYHQLKKQKNSWWNVLASENNSIKTIVGGFILYIGYLIVSSLNVDVLLLLYTIIVVGVIWYWVDMLRVQYEKNNKEYKQKMRVLSGEIRRWSKKKIVTEYEGLSSLDQRGYHIVQTLLPYIWGFTPEAIQQLDYYQYKGVSISSVQIRQERTMQEYWFLATELPQKHSEESTVLLPQPYQHDKWEKIAFNSAIELPEFKEKFGIYSSGFMHSYYLITRLLVEQFLALPASDKWMVFRKNVAYLVFPKEVLNFDITALEEGQKNAKAQALQSIQLADAFLKALGK
ncbi:hypothetical protein [Aureispira anguillae]|uniref:DUF3137 domain-containing protein n=1 Tax=Aureispira anguillae TaxID=2864201 RepID=A0A916DUX5_9BACT|nr:hypothetical protein [Aureispira anguillae]BDS12611.1 hypothetical protein AsAng_0033350 [Aureispira anguillae]